MFLSDLLLKYCCFVKATFQRWIKDLKYSTKFVLCWLANVTWNYFWFGHFHLTRKVCFCHLCQIYLVELNIASSLFYPHDHVYIYWGNCSVNLQFIFMKWKIIYFIHLLFNISMFFVIYLFSMIALMYYFIFYV